MSAVAFRLFQKSAGSQRERAVGAVGYRAAFVFVLRGNTKDCAQRSTFPLYTWGMIEVQPTKSRSLRQALIIGVCTVIGFYVGGGFRLQNTPISDIFVVHHHQGEDFSADIIAYTTMFVFFGGLGAVTGAGISTLALFALSKRKKS